MSTEHRTAVIGQKDNFWLYSSWHGFDLTHPPDPQSPKIYPRIPLETTTARVTIDPAKSALVVVDMQNFFLSPSLGKPKDSKGLKACDQLLKHAIPACRKAGIRIVWVNWGLTQAEIDVLPPAIIRAFGFDTSPANGSLTDNVKPLSNINSDKTQKYFKDPRLYRGVGADLGPVVLEDGSTVEGGRLLMRDQWNTELYPPLEKARREGASDVWIHKNRMSGSWGPETDCTKYLDAEGIRTLLFAGVNTDQCVGGTLTDSFSRGYDCLLLSDGAATTSPDFAQQCVEFNSAKTYGFVLSCKDLAKGVEKSETAE